LILYNLILQSIVELKNDLTSKKIYKNLFWPIKMQGDNEKKYKKIQFDIKK